MQVEQVAVLGGAGYLGSIISLELINKGAVVEIYDNLMFCDEFAEQQKVNQVNILRGFVSGTEFDKVVWCLDIDVPEFYTIPESAEYVKDNLTMFKKFAKQYKEKLVWVTDCFVKKPTTPYEEMLYEKEKITAMHNVQIVNVPNMYGPSPRMRFDTIVNTMIITSIMESAIYVDGWMDTVNVQSVAVVGKAIAQSIMENKLLKCKPITLTKLEIANIVKKAISEKVVILLSEEYTTMDGTRGVLSEYDKKAEFSIEKSIKYMLAGMENGMVDSIVKDMYNNSRIVSNYISTKGIHTLLGDLMR